ncbi:hypothetical protein HOD30_03710 [Candidatus Peregrinibacteria bacterium]|nr:hypothetical protein [Candidatus Peregrinibacteria bacterium]MBT4632367.1 hypothetical protein [Candidatus Peregrinibacteria bacterium]
MTSSLKKPKIAYSFGDGERLLFLWNVMGRLKTSAVLAPEDSPSSSDAEITYWGHFVEEDDFDEQKKADDHLQTCLKYNLVKRLVVEKWELIISDNETRDVEYSSIEETFDYSPESVIKKEEEVIIFYDLDHRDGIEEGGRPSFEYRYFLQIDQDKIQMYFNDYLEKWMNDELRRSSWKYKNILQPKEQLSSFLVTLSGLMSKYSHKDLRVEWLASDEADFISVVFFLEAIEVIEVLDFSLPKYIEEPYFRIKIFEDFSGVFDGDVPWAVDMEKVKNRFYQIKNADKLIVFDKNGSVHYEEKSHHLKSGFPLQLLKKARQHVKVKVSDLGYDLRLDQDRRKLKKNMGNFRRSLRGWFGFPESEKFFDLQGDEIAVTAFRFK